MILPKTLECLYGGYYNLISKQRTKPALAPQSIGLGLLSRRGFVLPSGYKL